MQDRRNYVYSRQEVARMLRRFGFPALADRASRELPDPVDVDQIETWGLRYGLTMAKVINHMGGSP